MPIFVDGVEMAEIWVDGVEMDTVYADGVQVFLGFQPEDYADTFQGGGATSAVPMNTGQFWNVGTPTPTAPQHAAGVWGAVGSRVSNIHNEAGTTSSQTLTPIVDIINTSFVASASMSWSPPSALVNQPSIGLGTGADLFITLVGIVGSYSVNFTVGADVESIEVPFLDVWQCDMKLYYDGTDCAASGTCRDSGSGVFNFTFPRRSAQGQVAGATGRTYSNSQSPLFAFIYQDTEIYNVHEEGIPPGDIPWP